jgi:hypothetical protein
MFVATPGLDDLRVMLLGGQTLRARSDQWRTSAGGKA